MRYLRYSILALCLSACSSVQTHEPSPPPAAAEPVDSVGVPDKVDMTGCPKAGSFQAADLSGPINQRFLDTMKKLKVGTIIRYGDYYPSRTIGGVLFRETITGKVPRAAELELIKRNGFKFMAVFQHNNSSFSSFTKTRGAQDAEMMQELYPNQPVWFFGVDWDASTAEQKNIEIYAGEFQKVARKYGKLTGAYGSGRTLTNLFAKKLIDRKWVSQSTGFGGTDTITRSGAYDILQLLPVPRPKTNPKCGGLEFDPNVVKGEIGAVAL